MRYKLAGKEKLLSFGPYPDVSLADAREARDKARATLRNGRDPGVGKRLRLAAAGGGAGAFEVIAGAWHARNASRWSQRHAADVLDSLQRDVFPALGTMHVNDITPPMVLAVLHPIEARPAVETARRARQRMSAVFAHAHSIGIGQVDRAAVVKGQLAPLTKKRQPAITDLDEAREMLRTAETAVAHPVTKLALRFLALTAVRPGEIRGAAWAEMESLNSTAALWRIPAERMKMSREHLVPLSRQAVAVLDAVRRLTGRGPLVFPNSRRAHRPMSENAIGYLLNRSGYHARHVPHGWRSTFSTVMNERHRTDRAVIDQMLAHLPKDRIGAAYNRAAHMERRRELAQEWADLLLGGMRQAEELIGGRRR